MGKMSDFMAFQEDVFKKELQLIVVWQVNHSLNNDEICHPHHHSTNVFASRDRGCCVI